MVGQPFRKIEGRRATDIVGHVSRKLSLECRIGLGLRIGPVQLEHQRHQRFRYIAPAEGSKPPVFVWVG